jgi:hypothetical protein
MLVRGCRRANRGTTGLHGSVNRTRSCRRRVETDPLAPGSTPRPGSPRSCGRRGFGHRWQTRSCYDNSAAESWFATLKAEIGTGSGPPMNRSAEPCSPTWPTTTTIAYIRPRLPNPRETRVSYRPDIALVAPSWHETPVSGPGVKPQRASDPGLGVIRPLRMDRIARFGWIIRSDGGS